MQAAYDAIAEWYDQIVRTADPVTSVIGPSLWPMIGEVHRQQICDLACGQGRLARQLAQQKAQVTGVDLSVKLIEIAQREEATQPLGIRYVVDDAMVLSALAAETFDGVICNMALMDLPDLEAVYNAVWRILRPRGWFVFSITHPCFSSPHAEWYTTADGQLNRLIHNYYPEVFWRSTNPKGVRGQVGAYHRMLSTYLNTLIHSGFHVVQMSEPQPLDATTAPPGYQVVPLFMLIKSIKNGP